MIFHKYKIEDKPLCGKKGKNDLWFVQDNDYKKLTIADDLCQKCWDWMDESGKLDDDILELEGHPQMYDARMLQVLLGYKKPRRSKLVQENIPF